MGFSVQPTQTRDVENASTASAQPGASSGLDEKRARMRDERLHLLEIELAVAHDHTLRQPDSHQHGHKAAAAVGEEGQCQPGDRQ